MLEIKNNWNNLVITNSEKKDIVLDTQNYNILVDDFEVSYPWEYEKSWILVEVKEYNENLFYHLATDNKNIVVITDDTFEIKEEILSFFWDVDLLVIKWSKESVKIFENIEARTVVAFWEWKDLFLNTLWQHSEEVESHKVKSDQSIDSTEFVNLAK